MDFRLTVPAKNRKVNARERQKTARIYTFQQENGDKTAKTGYLVVAWCMFSGGIVDV